MVDSNELSNKPILYELLEYFIRKQEPELIVSRYTCYVSINIPSGNRLVSDPVFSYIYTLYFHFRNVKTIP